MNNRLRMEYYSTYSFVNLIHDLAVNGYEVPEIYDGFDNFIELYPNDIILPFQKSSVLHQFIDFAVYLSFREEVDDVVLDSVVYDKNYILWLNEALKTYKITHLGFKDWLQTRSLSLDKLEHEETILEYYDYLYETGSFQGLLQQISDEVFFVLFMNRNFLYHFNKQISTRIAKIKTQDFPDDSRILFKKDGFLRRVNIPVWVKKAVFYRDRGICSNCQKDISGLINIHNSKHFDHIIPLASGGLNDISNFQLLCEACNLGKKDKEIQVSKIYERWYW